MSTPNFEFMKYGMPLIVADTDFDKMKEEFEEEYHDEYTEDIYYDDLSWIANNMQHDADRLNENLKYHTIEVKDGYYAGLQFTVHEIYENAFDLSKDSPYCLDNDDAHYYFDKCRSIVLREAEAEKRKIRKALKHLKDNGYIELSCDGVFSNGEAVYSIVR